MQIAAVSDCELVFDEVGEDAEEQENTDFSGDFEVEDTDEDEEPDEAPG